MTKCTYCGTESEEPKGYRRKFCDSCVSDKEIGASRILETIQVDGYGRVLKSRINEMARRVVLDDPKNKTDYFCGRLGEGGRIQERSPDYGG